MLWSWIGMHLCMSIRGCMELLVGAWTGMYVHLFSQKGFVAFRTNQHRIEHHCAAFVFVQHGSTSRIHHMDVTPMNDGHDNRIQIEALLGKDVFVTLRRILVGNAPQYTKTNQFLESLRE